MTGFLAGRSKLQGFPTISHMKDYPTVSLLFVLLAIVYFFAPWGFITMKNHHLGNLFGTFSKHQTSIQDNLIDMCKLSIFVGEWIIWVSKFFLVGMSEFWVICFCWLFIDLVCRLGCCDSFLVIFTSRIGLNINLRKNMRLDISGIWNDECLSFPVVDSKLHKSVWFCWSLLTCQFMSTNHP